MLGFLNPDPTDDPYVTPDDLVVVRTLVRGVLTAIIDNAETLNEARALARAAGVVLLGDEWEPTLTAEEAHNWLTRLGAI